MSNYSSLTGILASTYRVIRRTLHMLGYQRLQGSDWFCEPTDAVDTYWAMLAFRDIPPPGKLPSTLKGLKAHYIRDWVLNITEDLQLGGQYSPVLRGPTPCELVPLAIPSIAPPMLPTLLRYTRPSEEAKVLENWRIHPA